MPNEFSPHVMLCYVRERGERARRAVRRHLPEKLEADLDEEAEFEEDEGVVCDLHFF